MNKTDAKHFQWIVFIYFALPSSRPWGRMESHSRREDCSPVLLHPGSLSSNAKVLALKYTEYWWIYPQFLQFNSAFISLLSPSQPVVLIICGFVCIVHLLFLKSGRLKRVCGLFELSFIIWRFAYWASWWWTVRISPCTKGMTGW